MSPLVQVSDAGDDDRLCTLKRRGSRAPRQEIAVGSRRWFGWLYGFARIRSFCICAAAAAFASLVAWIAALIATDAACSVRVPLIVVPDLIIEV